MAGFQLSMYGRFWVSTEVTLVPMGGPGPSGFQWRPFSGEGSSSYFICKVMLLSPWPSCCASPACPRGRRSFSASIELPPGTVVAESPRS
jgi:hypothetical protein